MANTQHIHALTCLISLLSKGFSGVFSSTTDQRHLFFAHKSRSNQSVLREINPEYSLESLMLKLKLQFFDQLMRRANSLGKSLMLGKIEGRRRRGHQRLRWLDASLVQWTWTWANFGKWWRIGRPGLLQFMPSQRTRHNCATEQRYMHIQAYACSLYIYVILCIFKYLTINLKNILSHLSSNFSTHSFFLISVFAIFLFLNNMTLFQFASWNSRNWFLIH